VIRFEPRTATSRLSALRISVLSALAALLLAAGASSRMGGRDKLLEPVGDRPLLRAVAERLLASKADEVVCVVRPGTAARRAALDGLGARIVENPRAEAGMGTSIAAGVAALAPEVDAALIALADMPEIDAEAIETTIAALADAWETAEAREGVSAFFEKRRPNWIRGEEGR